MVAIGWTAPALKILLDVKIPTTPAERKAAASAPAAGAFP
jgi:hypothetical protein